MTIIKMAEDIMKQATRALAFMRDLEQRMEEAEFVAEDARRTRDAATRRVSELERQCDAHLKRIAELERRAEADRVAR